MKTTLSDIDDARREGGNKALDQFFPVVSAVQIGLQDGFQFALPHQLADVVDRRIGSVRQIHQIGVAEAAVVA